MARADARLRRAGFKPLPGRPGVWRRGTRAGSVLASDPSAVQTDVTVLTAQVDGKLRVRYSMHAMLFGQVTRSDMMFWRGELDALGYELRSGEPTTVDMSWARRASVEGLLIPILSLLLPLIPIWFLLMLVGPLGGLMLLLYGLAAAAAFMAGVWWLRRGMPTAASLSLETSSNVATVAAGDQVQGDVNDAVAKADALRQELKSDLDNVDAGQIGETLEQMALDDFDRRLAEGSAQTLESIKEEVEAEMATRKRG